MSEKKHIVPQRKFDGPVSPFLIKLSSLYHELLTSPTNGRVALVLAWLAAVCCPAYTVQRDVKPGNFVLFCWEKLFFSWARGGSGPDLDRVGTSQVLEAKGIRRTHSGTATAGW